MLVVHQAYDAAHKDLLVPMNGQDSRTRSSMLYRFVNIHTTIMVFTTLDDDEKHAFFGLLDELSAAYTLFSHCRTHAYTVLDANRYFTSRPEILGKLTNGQGHDPSGRSPTDSPARRVLGASPDAANVIAAGLRHVAAAPKPTPPPLLPSVSCVSKLSWTY